MSENYDEELLVFIKNIIDSFGEMKTTDVNSKAIEAGFRDVNCRKHLRKLERDGTLTSSFGYTNGSTAVNVWKMKG